MKRLRQALSGGSARAGTPPPGLRRRELGKQPRPESQRLRRVDFSTEIAVPAVVSSILLSLFLYRDLDWARFREAMIQCGIAASIVMPVTLGSSVIAWILTFDQVPMKFAEWVAANFESKFLILIALNILMLIVGMPLDLPPAVMLPGRSSCRSRPPSASTRCSSG